MIWLSQVISCHNQLLHSLALSYFCITFILVYCFHCEHARIDEHMNFSCYDVLKKKGKKRYFSQRRRFAGPGVFDGILRDVCLRCGLIGLRDSTILLKTASPPSCKITWWMYKYRNVVVKLNCKWSGQCAEVWPRKKWEIFLSALIRQTDPFHCGHSDLSKQKRHRCD